MTEALDARADWENRIYDRSDQIGSSLDLPSPGNLKAVPGVGSITLSWDSVSSASGYVIQLDEPNKASILLRHGGSDVVAVPGNHFVVTGLLDHVIYGFRVGAIATPEHLPKNWSHQISATTKAFVEVGQVRIEVDAALETGKLERVWEMVGSERLSQLMVGADSFGNQIGAEFLESIRRAHDDLGVKWIRAHAIFHDDLGVARRRIDGTLVFDFAAIDNVYDQLLKLGVRPVVELSFMPEALASDPTKTVFTYRGIISPPTDWKEWYALIQAFVEHLVDRYGLDEVVQWPFEVWNEANLEVFWTGSRDEYLQLYDEAALAVKSVCSDIKVGGPSSAACEWVEALASHAKERGIPLDFVSTHTYGNLPLDLRPVLERYGFGDIPIYWTEWGIGSTHFGPVHDSVAGAPFVLLGYEAVQGRMDSLAYWVVSDHFEELGRPPRLFHDGFGLLSVGNLAKPRYWGVHLAAHQGDTVLQTNVAGDVGTIHVSATKNDVSDVDVLIWNGTINTEIMRGDQRLSREVTLNIAGLQPNTYRLSLARVDEEHSNIIRHLPEGVAWPDSEQWDELRRWDYLFEESLANQNPIKGTIAVKVFLPHPSVVRLRLCPVDKL
ncbi:GH39 family glycosyl hydrolase [Acidithrix ferrooxidans]|uniref:Beta-xylosidase n=2 Tax=root TaxID=1 RepID=A0A0D8HFG8_9ACTN|nr:hypothetical protein [Acidithrix ferrooxidans]KJF16668.1 beta-xylosidase [Acidithrix ferrooxidans]